MQALQHYAGSIEMIALCMFMQYGPSREVDNLLEHASNWYTRSCFDGVTTGVTGGMDSERVSVDSPSDVCVGGTA